MHIKHGFTLAEVLITLGIIGVVAALTIPSTIAKYQKKVTVTQLQKAVSILNQAYRTSIAEVGEHENAFELGVEEYFNTYWKPYIKILKECPRNTNVARACGYSLINPFVWTNKTQSDRNLNQGGNDRIVFYAPDGFLYIIHSGLHGNLVKCDEIIVDLNGYKGPNQFGRDVFSLVRTKDTILPLGYNKSDNDIKTNCSATGRGEYCAERIRRNGWQIDTDYPW